jgi:hypothetical protein
MRVMSGPKLRSQSDPDGHGLLLISLLASYPWIKQNDEFSEAVSLCRMELCERFTQSRKKRTPASHFRSDCGGRIDEHAGDVSPTQHLNRKISRSNRAVSSWAPSGC